MLDCALIEQAAAAELALRRCCARRACVTDGVQQLLDTAVRKCASRGHSAEHDSVNRVMIDEQLTPHRRPRTVLRAELSVRCGHPGRQQVVRWKTSSAHARSSTMGGDRDAARLLTALGAHMLTGRHGAGAHLVAAPAASEQGRPKEVYRKDYAPPEFLIPAVSLHFTLGVGDESTIVKAALSCERVGSIGAPLVLDGEGLDLLSLCIDGVAVPASGYTISNETNASTTLTIAAAALPAATSFTVETTVEIFPASNHQGDGLYMSAETFVTQCEPQGFRRITFHQDRPDILSVYTVTVDGDTKACPVLLSNGNRVDQGEAEGRHFITFLDPFPKPTYLFALVAGDLGCFQDTFTTMSGRVVQLGIYTEHTNVDRCEFAMKCLKSCMAWDEEQFGLEYDLDLFNIVAVSQFGGAMENKSLNIFSLGLIVATPESTTDAGLESVDAVIAHECV